MHLPQWRFPAGRRGANWEVPITDNRHRPEAHQTDNPSLRRQADTAMAAAYRRACRHAALETDLPRETFPATRPWSLEQSMDPDFQPDQADWMQTGPWPQDVALTPLDPARTRDR
jgi:hypothetical protein